MTKVDRFSEVFGWQAKPIIGMVHFPPLPKHPNYAGTKAVLENVYRKVNDLFFYMDGLMFENWHVEHQRTLTAPSVDAAEMDFVIRETAAKLMIPFGVNVLHNDSRAALEIVNNVGGDYIWVDVFVDRVQMDFPPHKIVRFSPSRLIEHRSKLKAEEILIFASIQPKHYILLEEGKTIECSVEQAIEAEADALVVTGQWTGHAPGADKLRRVKKVAGAGVPVLVGSGLTAKNAPKLLEIADGAIVGTYISASDFSRIVISRVARLTDVISKIRGL